MIPSEWIGEVGERFDPILAVVIGGELWLLLARPCPCIVGKDHSGNFRHCITWPFMVSSLDLIM